MANEQTLRYIWTLDGMELLSSGGWVLYDNHLAIVNELKEGQMHLAQEVDAKDAEIAGLKAEVERLSAPISSEEWDNGPAREADINELTGEEIDFQYVLTRSEVDALILARKEGR